MRPISHIATISIGLCAVAVSACNGPTSSFSPPANSIAQSHVRGAAASPTPSPVPFVFQTIDDPNSYQNRVTGINQLGKVVGVWGGGQGSSLWQSYYAVSPYTKFRPINYPGAQGTYVTSLSSNKIQAGYVIDPGGQTEISGFAKIGGVWYTFNDPNQGTGNNAVTEIWGVNDSEYAAGFYVNSSGNDVAFELNIPTNTYTDLAPPGATGAVQATGIDGKENMSGWEVTASGAKGFFYEAGTYYALAYPGATNTYALSLNWQDQVVGSYTDQAGMSHGFMLTGPTRGGSQMLWQSIDAPNATQGTWVTGINNHGQICGYYVDAAGHSHGFLANP